jgi:integrase
VSKVSRRKPRTRANGEGRVWRRAGDGRWAGIVYPPDGGKARHVYGKTRDEAKAKKAALERDLADGLPAKDDTLGKYLEKWMTVTLPEEVRAGHLAASTLDSYRDNARKHIIPDLGGIQLRRLSVSQVRRWQDGLLLKPSGRQRRRLRKDEKKLPPPALLSPRTVAYCHAILHRALEDARRDELITRNVTGLVKPPKAGSRKRAALTREQTAALLEAGSRDTLWCYWLVVLTLGLRRGEGLGLRWDDIDFDARTVRLSRTVQRIRGEDGKSRLMAKELKTEASEATVPVGDSVLGALRKQQRFQRRRRMRSKAWLDAGLVFSTSAGTALEPRNVSRAWDKVCGKAGVHARIHDLRHACATYLHDEGLPMKAIQATLRHARISTTELYIHALSERNREAAEKIDNVVTSLRKGRRRAAGKTS